MDWDGLLADVPADEVPARPAPEPRQPEPEEPEEPGPPAGWTVAVTGPDPVAGEPDAPAAFSLGAGWTVVPGPGRWGTVHIADPPAPATNGTADDSRPEDTQPEDTEPDETAEAAPDGTPTDDAPAEPAAASVSRRRRPTSDDLTADLLVRSRRHRPSSGWRGALHRASGRTVNPGESPAEARERELAARVRVPTTGCFRVAVVSLKGGVGKTTTAFCLGATLSSLRGDRVIALDANPDAGTLAEHVRRQTDATVWDLLGRSTDVASYAEIRRYTSQSPDRLEVLASARDPLLSHAFDADDYARVMTLAERYYTLVVTDCGTGLVHSAMAGVLAAVDQLVLVSSASLDGARSASATLDWLEAQGHGALAEDACVVVNSVRSRSAEIDLDRLQDHFAARARSVVLVPYDDHLAGGTTIELAALHRRTRRAWVELAAAVLDRGGQ